MALYDGATELDMVINISALKSGKTEAVQAEILDVADLCHVHQALLKVIIETALLSEEEIELACRLCVAGEADFVKTSTGFASRGASVADVELMRRVLPETIRIKAAGGIRTRAAAEALVAAGADRIGSSNSVALIAETDEPTSAYACSCCCPAAAAGGLCRLGPAHPPGQHPARYHAAQARRGCRARPAGRGRNPLSASICCAQGPLLVRRWPSPKPRCRPPTR